MRRSAGSLAEGRAVPGSDADVLVLLDRSDRRWLDRPLDYSDEFAEIGLGVELFCYTLDELQRVPLARDARAGGIVLAAR
jgi:predicted nucleotidyltransferase